MIHGALGSFLSEMSRMLPQSWRLFQKRRERGILIIRMLKYDPPLLLAN
jgi:hypothetical protein